MPEIVSMKSVDETEFKNDLKKIVEDRLNLFAARHLEPLTKQVATLERSLLETEQRLMQHTDRTVSGLAARMAHRFPEYVVRSITLAMSGQMAFDQQKFIKEMETLMLPEVRKLAGKE